MKTNAYGLSDPPPPLPEGGGGGGPSGHRHWFLLVYWFIGRRAFKNIIKTKENHCRPMKTIGFHWFLVVALPNPLKNQ